MKDILTVMKFTIKDMVRRKSFIISTLIILVLIVIGFNIPKILKSIKDSHLDEEKEMESIWEVGGAFQITAVTFKNLGDSNTRKMANDAYAQRVNKEWYLRILELTKLFFTFGDDLERIFDGKYEELAVNSYKTGIWYYLDIIKLAENQEVHIKKIRDYEEKIRLYEPDYESKLDFKVNKNKSSFFGRLLSRNLVIFN